MQDTQIEPKHDIVQPQKKPIKNYLIGLAVLVIILVVMSATSQKTEEANETIQEADQESVVINDINEIDEQIKIITDDFTMGYKLNDFSDLEEATQTINTYQNKPTEGPGSEVLVNNIVNAETENDVYFATMSLNKDTGENFVGIYSYNTLTNNWNRLYKKTFEETDGVTNFYRVLAKSENNLVLLKDVVKQEDEPCENYWSTNSELVLMNTDNPYAEFVQFEFPKELEQVVQEEQEKCKIELE